jgi:hypothetical protein
MQEVASSKPIKQLVVSAVSKEVRLPENEVTLSAFTVPAEQPGMQLFWRSSLGLLILQVCTTSLDSLSYT